MPRPHTPPQALKNLRGTHPARQQKCQALPIRRHRRRRRRPQDHVLPRRSRPAPQAASDYAGRSRPTEAGLPKTRLPQALPTRRHWSAARPPPPDAYGQQPMHRPPTAHHHTPGQMPPAAPPGEGHSCSMRRPAWHAEAHPPRTPPAAPAHGNSDSPIFVTAASTPQTARHPPPPQAAALSRPPCPHVLRSEIQTSPGSLIAPKGRRTGLASRAEWPTPAPLRGETHPSLTRPAPVPTQRDPGGAKSRDSGLKQWWGIATRYEKTATIYLAGLYVAGIFLWSARTTTQEQERTASSQAPGLR